MAFNQNIRILDTEDTNHAENFNEVYNQLLENTKDNSSKLNILNGNITTINSKINLQVPTNNDLNNAMMNGNYSVSGGTTLNAPSGFVLGNYGVCVVYVFASTLYHLLLTTDKTYTRSKVGTTWNTWKDLSTSDKIDISFPYNTGFMAYGGGYASKITKVNNYVQITILYKKTDGTAFNGINTIGVLPSGYRPSEYLVFNGSASVIGGVEIRSDGTILVNSPSATNYGILLGFYI